MNNRRSFLQILGAAPLVASADATAAPVATASDRPTHQKFLRGDKVRVSSEFPRSMGHFSGRGEIAVICGSYRDQFGGGDDSRAEYTLFFESLDGKPYNSRISWYGEGLLGMVEPRAMANLYMLDGIK